MKNKIVIVDKNTIGIEINYKGEKKIAYIDKEDLSKVDYIKGTWHLGVNKTGHIDGVKTKVQVNLVRKQIWMHNCILTKKDSNNVIDHRDGNTLNNRKSNLREVSPQENSTNTITVKNTHSGIRNVCKNGKYWDVIFRRKKYKTFKDKEDAIRYANQLRQQIFPLTEH